MLLNVYLELSREKYQILQTPLEYLIDIQTRIILACIGLHNWVRGIEGLNADMLLEADTEDKGVKEAT
jgi:hypothetical protein